MAKELAAHIRDQEFTREEWETVTAWIDGFFQNYIIGTDRQFKWESEDKDSDWGNHDEEVEY